MSLRGGRRNRNRERRRNYVIRNLRTLRREVSYWVSRTVNALDAIEVYRCATRYLENGRLRTDVLLRRWTHLTDEEGSPDVPEPAASTGAGLTPGGRQAGVSRNDGRVSPSEL